MADSTMLTADFPVRRLPELATVDDGDGPPLRVFAALAALFVCRLATTGASSGDENCSETAAEKSWGCSQDSAIYCWHGGSEQRHIAKRYKSSDTHPLWLKDR